VLLRYKGDSAAQVGRTIAWFQTQTGRRVQRVRHDRCGEYMGSQLLTFYADKDIQLEPTSGYSPGVNG
jgi:hypothetical protein